MVEYLHHLALLLIVFVTVLHAAVFTALQIVKAIKEIGYEIKRNRRH